MEFFSGASRSTSAIISSVIEPCLKMTGSRDVTSMTVLSIPNWVGSPHTTASMRPSRSSRTACQVVAEGLPDRLALGATNGVSASRISSRAIGSRGMRMATVSSPAVTSLGTAGCFFRTNVKGPGQKALKRSVANSGTSLAKRLSCSISAI